jgi:hypothetical protein
VSYAYAGGTELREPYEALLKLLHPFAPHMTEELWAMLGNETMILRTKWPVADRSLMMEDTVVIAVQVNGKLRGQVEVAAPPEESRVMDAVFANEKIGAWLADKELVKTYIKATVGDEYNIPTIAVLHSPGQVDGFQFPERCIIKPTHASAQYILRRGGEPIDRERIKSWFRMNYYYAGREVNYKTLKPKVIVEPLAFDSSDLTDYRFYCVNGVPKLIQLDMDRHTRHTRKLFDPEWREHDFCILYPKSDRVIPKPDTLDEMLRVARALSAPFSFVRIDLYSDGQKVICGEITNVSANAGGIFNPLSSEKKASQILWG